MRRLLVLCFACTAGSTDTPIEPTPLDGVVLANATVVGVGVMDIALNEGRIVQPAEGMQRIDLTGAFLTPSFIDAHVHLAYDARGAEMVRGGLAGAVDWAAPLDRMTATGGPTVVWSGPMITAEGGYPLDSWGADGYGLAVSSPAQATAAVDTLQAAGARVIKVPLGAGAVDLSDEVIAAAIARAHELGLQVGVHALSDEQAARGARLGADILVHAPRTVSEQTAQAWSGRAVVPTISAFNGFESTRTLVEAGVEVLYGTDFGNTGVAAISEREISGMVAAGLSGAQILAAGTSVPAARFGFDDLGSLQIGKEASLLVLNADPLIEPTTLAQPKAVLHRGTLVAGELE